jgi:hypothetical protein
MFGNLPPDKLIVPINLALCRYCADNIAGSAAFVTGGGFHFPVRASLFGE